MMWIGAMCDKCVSEGADVTCCRKGVLLIQKVQLPPRDLETISVSGGCKVRSGCICGVILVSVNVPSTARGICNMEYTGHSEKFCMEDESDCVGDVVSSDADEFDVEQLDPSGQDDVSDGDVFGLTAAEIENKVFRTEERAYEFYMRFGKCHGFGVRKGDYGKDDDGNVIKRRFFCNRDGLRDEKHYNRFDRKRCHKPETEMNCQAKLSIYLNKESSNWKVRKVILEHNHELVARCMVHLIPKFYWVSGAAKDQLFGMQSYGLPMSKILGYMAGIAGGYPLLGFTKKDAYNYLDRTKRARIVDGTQILPLSIWRERLLWTL
ncbi:hypothetical protein Ahy_B05g078885 [Arachis hypogaea]|uniref:FAR1 domain-containing protein n=1 Tax=Arachis hypogaea TaxID=3818 RepID=A0A444Z8B6_ARAHY|nr:hypothetical protein Ahy_B05g078885 [Arachis hypogaea]